MRRVAFGLTALALVLSSPAFAKSPSHREQRTYSTPGGMQGVINGSTNVAGSHLGFVQIPSRKTDRTVRVKVSDVTGRPVAFELAQWREHGEKDLGEFCTTSPRLKLPWPGRSVIVYVNVGTCPDGASVPTTGTVTATYR